MTQITNGEKYRCAPARVIARVLGRPRDITAEGCWLWTGQVAHDGYGFTTYSSREIGKQVVLYVHRLAYMHFRGDPGDDMQVDHACHVPGQCAAPGDECPHRRCYNPAHLKAVTPAENIRRRSPRTLCASGRGHKLTPDNIIWRDGQRCCKECEQLAAERKQANAKPPRARQPKPVRQRRCLDCGTDISDRPYRARYCTGCAAERRRAALARSASAAKAASRAKTAARRQGRCCVTCGADISHKKASAMYCDDCIKEQARIAARDRWRRLHWGTGTHGEAA